MREGKLKATHWLSPTPLSRIKQCPKHSQTMVSNLNNFTALKLNPEKWAIVDSQAGSNDCFLQKAQKSLDPVIKATAEIMVSLICYMKGNLALEPKNILNAFFDIKPLVLSFFAKCT